MKGKYRRAVFVVAFARPLGKEGKAEYLLLKRKLHWSGWEFPKGAIEFLETEKNAVKRELFEETGLKPFGKVKKIGWSGKYDYGKKLEDRPGYKGQTFSLYAVEVKKSKVKLDKREHIGHKWASFSQALRLLKWPNQKKSLKMVDSFIVDGKVS